MQFIRIKELREDGELTQKEIANYLKITQQQYSLYEIGTRTIPVELLIELSKLYEKTTDYILGLSDDERTAYIKNQINIKEGNNFGKITIN